MEEVEPYYQYENHNDQNKQYAQNVKNVHNIMRSIMSMKGIRGIRKSHNIIKMQRWIPNMPTSFVECPVNFKNGRNSLRFPLVMHQNTLILVILA